MKIDCRYVGSVPYFVVADGTEIAANGVTIRLGPEPDGKPAVTAVTQFGVTQFVCQTSFDELRADVMKGAN